MPSAAKAVSDRLAEHTLADLVHRFEQLSEEYDRAEEALVAGKSLDVHRRDVDVFHSITAGICLLAAVGKGFIQSLDSAVWNLVDARTERIKSQSSQLSRLQQQWKELADPASWNIGAPSYEGYYSPSELAALYADVGSPVRLEPLDIDARCREAESQIQKLAQLQGELELESELDLTSEEGRLIVINSWLAYVRLELIPNHVSQFRPDWKEQLLPPDLFLAYGAKDSGQRNPTQTLLKDVPGTTKEDRFRHCVSARANIYATACRVIAKMLKAEMERRLSEIGVQASGERGKGEKKPTVARRSNEELFRAALRKHHQYDDGSVLNTAPASTRDIEKLVGISDSTAQRLLTKHFDSVKSYREACFSGAINQKLIVLLGDGLHAYGTFDTAEHDPEESTDEGK